MSGAAASTSEGGTNSHGEQVVVVISGPSGCGKTTIVERIVSEQPVPLVKAVSATTRPPRPGEVHGESYFFLDDDDFAARREAGEFLEYAEVHGRGHWYGTLRSELDRAREMGAWSLLEIDVQGALAVIDEFPDTLSIFVRTPSEDEYERRLRGRGTESDEVIAHRLETARRELEQADRYRYTVVNDDLERAVSETRNILKDREAGRHAG